MIEVVHPGIRSWGCDYLARTGGAPIWQLGRRISKPRNHFLGLAAAKSRGSLTRYQSAAVSEAGKRGGGWRSAANDEGTEMKDAMSAFVFTLYRGPDQRGGLAMTSW